MNHIKNFFDFLRDKEKRTPPFVYRLVYEPESLESHDLFIDDNLDVEGVAELKQLPDGLTIAGYLDVEGTGLTSLPNNLRVKGSLFANSLPLKELPRGLKVGVQLYLNRTQITTLPRDIEVRGGLRIAKTPLAQSLIDEFGEEITENPKGIALREKIFAERYPGIKGPIEL
jgi:hypothetical protein